MVSFTVSVTAKQTPLLVDVNTKSREPVAVSASEGK